MAMDSAYYFQITDKKRQAAIVRSEIEYFTNQFFFDKSFVFVEPPVLHEAIANKKAEIYLSVYNEKYSLSSSNALYMGMYASEFEKVFTMSKCFRDENETSNHLIEFSILEVEMLHCAFDDMLEIILEYLTFILDISDIDYLMSNPLKDTVIIVDYPSKFATWTAEKKENGKSMAMNIMLSESYGELCEGCQRTNDVLLLQNKIRLAKADSIQWYVDAINKIETERSGFGLGIDRLVRWIIGADRISDTRFFPRIK